MDNNLKILGIAKKAGKLEIGEESVSYSVRYGKAKIVISASDASVGSKRHAGNFASAGGIPHIVVPFMKFELGGAVGRGSPGMLAITDIGIASSFVSKLAESESGQYSDAASELQSRSMRAIKRRDEARAHERNIRTGKRRTIK